MAQPFVWNVDPVLVRLGSVHVRYYGIFFGIALLTGFLVWNRRVRRFGESQAFAESWLWWGIAAVVIGGRLGHCFFYRPRTYLADPVRVLYLWEGGVSSHGVAVGIMVALWFFARRHAVSWTRLGDYIVPAVALGVGWIRLGNFFNSELLGRATDVPWAVVFARVDAVPRHAVQLYDFAVGPLVWLLLRELERRNIRPIGSGLITGAFLTTYFSCRIVVEAFKDFYVEQLRTMGPFRAAEELAGFPIHTGQWLSILPVLGGIAFIVRALLAPPALANPSRS